MSFRVYISHSVGPHELGAIYGVAELAARKGMEPIVPDRMWSPEAPPARIAQLLKSLGAFVAIATVGGQNLAWVNAELSEGVRQGMSLDNVVSIIDGGVTAPSTRRLVVIDRAHLPTTITNAVSVLEQIQLEQTNRNLLAGLVLGGLVALLLASKD